MGRNIHMVDFTQLEFASAPHGSTFSLLLENKGEQQIPLMMLPDRILIHRIAVDGQNHVVYDLTPWRSRNAIVTVPSRLGAQTEGTIEMWARALPPAHCHKLQLTHLNDAILSQVAMSPLEPFWFTGAHGDKVQGFLVKPPNFDASKKYPVKFLIHGGPQGAWGDDWSYRWNAELFAAPTSATSSGYVVMMINFHGSTGYGQKFIDAINGDWGGAPFEDLMKGLDYAEEHYTFIDKSRECALGASYGLDTCHQLDSHSHTDRFKCIVSHDGMFNAESALGHETRRTVVQQLGVQGHALRQSRERYLRSGRPHQYAPRISRRRRW